MSEHLDLFELLRGELGNAETVAAGDHLAACPTCQEELADAVVGHALLVRAGRTLGGAAEPVPPPLRVAPRRRRTTALLALAAVLVLFAAVAGVAVWRDPGGVEATLAPVDGAGAGTVRMVEDAGHTRMTLVVSDLPDVGGGEYYYAWLLDPDTNKMLALGVVDPDRGATFDLDDTLVAAYSSVDVSLEADDGDPAHSVTSVLRGSYTTTTNTAGRNHP